MIILSAFAAILVALVRGEPDSGQAAKHALVSKANPLRLSRTITEPNPSTLLVAWQSAVATSRTSVTMQVVSNALLDRKTPVSSAMFKTLSKLPLDNIRYVPWFVMPLYAVPELLPPANGKTSWNFSYAQPMLEDFFAATKDYGLSSLTNFATQPAWMYKNWSGPNYPSNPFEKDVPYARGTELRDQSGKELVEYYQRLLQWIVKGRFVDEAGVEHTGGPRAELTQWEVFNEPQGCHNMSAQSYTKLYDAIVAGIRDVVDPDGKMRFAMGGLQQLDELSWAVYLLNPANHEHGPGRDSLDGGLLTFHFYAGSQNRTDPEAYESFFDTCQQYFKTTLYDLVIARDTLSPATLLSCDEMGTILPGDNDDMPIPFPLVYWNAASAKFAYMFQEFSRLGVDIAGMSQLAGNPVIPEWGIAEAQYPSVAILNWTTGEGTARYWTLGMIHEHFAPGDQVIETTIVSPTMCGVVGTSSGFGDITLSCADPDATISSIDFADFGMPTGSCGAYMHNATCTTPNVTAFVQDMCLNQQSCTVASTPTFGQACGGKDLSFVIQAHCSKGLGSAGAASATAVEAQAYADVNGNNKRILLLNKEFAHTTLDITSLLTPGKPATLLVIDEATGFGPAREESITSATLHLAPFAVAILQVASIGG